MVATELKFEEIAASGPVTGRTNSAAVWPLLLMCSSCPVRNAPVANGGGSLEKEPF